MKRAAARFCRGAAATALAILLATPGLARVAAAETLRVGKPTPIAFNFAMPEIGTQAGIFAKNGLTLEVVALEGSAKLHQAMVAGSIDIAIGAGTDFLFPIKGAPEKGIIAMAGPPANFFLAVPTGSPIRSIDDLKGKRVSISTVGSLSQWFVQQLSRREGWGDDGIVPVATGGQQATAVAFASGSIDAAFQSIEGVLLMEDKGTGRRLFSFADFIHPFLTHAVFATDDVIAKNPDAVRRFVKAWLETVAFAKTHKDDAVRFAQSVTHAAPEAGAKIYDVEMPAMSESGKFGPDAVKMVLNSLIEMKQIDAVPDGKTLYTEEFLPKTP